LLENARTINNLGRIERMAGGVSVELERLLVQFDDFVAVRDADVRIEPGEFFSFLGPSGCGKTTILRTVSGFLHPTRGAVKIDGKDMSRIGPNKRPTALIFQNLALFPLMTVWENIAFALEMKGVDAATRRRRAEELLELIALGGQGDKYVHELSGGQKQRVAIARALCAEPSVLLLDEPLSALDLKLRQHMRTELRAIQQRVGLTFIYITHDQGEALTMSDHVAVMREGVIEQIGDGRTIYDDPATAFVASFVGENNALPGRVEAIHDGVAMVATTVGRLAARVATAARGKLREGAEAILFIRPEAIDIDAEGAAPEATIETQVMGEEFEGPNLHLRLAHASGTELRASLVNKGTARTAQVGTALRVVFDPLKAVALPTGALSEEE
jgi:spermidine/putrescine transport system ATP-binding protein